MIILFGILVVIGSVLGGFIMAGGRVIILMHFSELVIIGGAASGALAIMAPKRVLIDMFRIGFAALKGAPHGRDSYEELFKGLYELFLLGRRNGMIALEEHISNPAASTIFQRYPRLLNNAAALEFLCGGLQPVIDGKIKPDQLRQLFQLELERMEEEHQAPVNVLTRIADALPGFGIVAAVLGIVITMASIAGPVEQIGEKVAAALVGTFLGIFLSYGFLGPLAVNMEFTAGAQLSYFRCLAACVIGFATGMAPAMAVEMGRRSLNDDLRPGAGELEEMLKLVGSAAKPKSA